MESLQQIGTNGGIVERCRECRGHVVQAGDEFVCASCGIVARKAEQQEEKFHLEVHVKAPSQLAGRRLGSYMGERSDVDSTADFNGTSTIGHAKRISDNMGQDQTAWLCASIIKRAADRLSLPTFVSDSAVVLAEKILAAGRANQEPGRHRTSVPAISAYALLCASREAGMDRISSKALLQTYVDMGHRVTKSTLLKLGIESPVPLRPADPASLLRTVVSGLESNEAVKEKLAKNNIEPGPYFRRLLQASQAIVNAIRSMEEGRNPRTVAAGAVYMASMEVGPRAATQREVAEIIGIAEYTIREFVAAVSRKVPRPLNACGP